MNAESRFLSIDLRNGALLVRHIVAWNYRDGIPDIENRKNALIIKRELESLVHDIDGILELNVHIDVLTSSNRAVCLNSLFVNETALDNYQVHPKHKVISSFISSVTRNRACVDYNE